MPERTFIAAMFTASSPEAQNRSICSPATTSGRPAASAAARAMTPPWSPTGVTTPSTTSSIAAGSSAGNRRRISWISPTTSEIGLTSWSDPDGLPRPRGVRIAS